ncbi:Checkpoint protein hus1 [Tilletia horrida]|uniref:Checkpoint protein n=1 Tax=Tilletia horrida TaxID=155126 RepID=A0AAN6GL61_9BASI|nr:Checkpoint protein hus1 [Tilletia horrida]
MGDTAYGPYSQALQPYLLDDAADTLLMLLVAPQDQFFAEFRIESNNKNKIYIEVATETLLKAFRSGLNAVQVTMRLAKRNQIPMLSLHITNASHMGGRLVVVQDVLIRILKPAEMERIKEPLCPAPDVRRRHSLNLLSAGSLTIYPNFKQVHITLPPLLKLRTVCERMRTQSDVATISANREGKFKVEVFTDELKLETCWRNLQHPNMDVEANELEAPEGEFRGVPLELKSFLRFLASYVVETTTIASICKNHCAIFYVYIGDTKHGKGVMSFFLPGVEVDS